MKPLIIILLLLPVTVWGQFGVNFHQSNLPFAGLNYEIKDKFRPEIRIGADNFIEDLNLELVLTYDLLEKDEYEVYSGVGFRGSDFRGLTIPIGVNFYPFAVKNFGFHIELTPIIGEASILRGSWGIRYRFNKIVNGQQISAAKVTPR